MISGDIMDYIVLSDKYGIMEIALPPHFIKKTIQEVDFRKKYSLDIIAVRNPFKDYIIVPGVDYAFGADDSIVVIGDNNKLNVFKKEKSFYK